MRPACRKSPWNRPPRRRPPTAAPLIVAVGLATGVGLAELLDPAAPAQPTASVAETTRYPAAPYPPLPQRERADPRQTRTTSPPPSPAFGVEIIASAPSAPGRAAIAGRPSRVTDGDTLRFGKVRVRLAGIDAPELATPEGQAARRHLIDLIGPAGVRCDDTGQRSYGRVVGRCYLPDGRDLAAAMVEAGWAKDLPRFSGGRYANR